MSSKEDKKPLPPNAGPPTDHGVEQVEVVKEVVANQKRLMLGLAAVTVVVLAVIGASLLGVYLSRDPNIVSGNRLWKVNGEVLKEKIEVDIEAKTETFYTEANDGGSSALMHDVNTGLSAYKFDIQEKCYITDYEEDMDEVNNLAQRVEDGEDGDVEEAEVGPSKYLSVDQSREPFNRSALSDRMDDFCGSLETHWGVKTAEKPGTQEADPTGTTSDDANAGAVTAPKAAGEPQERKKRWNPLCWWAKRWVCRTVCNRVCGRKKRAVGQGKEEETEEQPTRVKRFWGGRRRRRWVTCPNVCRVVCGFVWSWVCNSIIG